MPRNKIKICPFCREEIDLLALKCVHCGERVGQPLGTERQLSIDDIGRPKEEKSEMSDSFVSAYEKMAGSSMIPDTSTLPKLPTNKMRKLKNVFTAVVAILVLVGLFHIADHVFKSVMGMEHNRKIRESEEMMTEAEIAAQQGDLITAVQRAREARTVYTEDEDAARKASEWSDMLSKKARAKFDEGNLREALEFCDQAIEADPTNIALPTLRKLIRNDIRRYTLRLQGVYDGGARIIKPDGTVVSVKMGDKITDLGFRLVEVDTTKGTVVLRDERRQRDLSLVL